MWFLRGGNFHRHKERCEKNREGEFKSQHDCVLRGVEGIEALAEGCQTLRRLRISRNARVTAEALARLATRSALETLGAVRCARAGEAALRRNLGRFAGTCRVDVVGDDFAWTASDGG